MSGLLTLLFWIGGFFALCAGVAMIYVLFGPFDPTPPDED